MAIQLPVALSAVPKQPGTPQAVITVRMPVAIKDRLDNVVISYDDKLSMNQFCRQLIEAAVEEAEAIQRAKAVAMEGD